MKEFSTLKRIFENFKTDVDALAESYERMAVADNRYNDEIRAERARERNADYNNRIDALAARAQDAATTEIKALEATLGQYIAAGDADRLTKLQTIAAAGLELSPVEADSLAAGASYLELRMLEQITGGRIKAPNLAVYEQDLKDLKFKTSGLKSYRGGLAGISTSTGLFGGYDGKSGGLGANLSSNIVEGWLTSSGKALAEMHGRWAVVKEG